MIFSTLCLYCYLGDNFTEKFIGLEKVAYEIDWFMFPVEVQKDLAYIMLVASKEVYLRGFGRVYCSLEMLMEVSFFQRKRKNLIFFSILESMSFYFLDYETYMVCIYDIKTSLLNEMIFKQ